MACGDVTKTHFFKHFQRDFDEICTVDIKLMYDKVPQSSCRYMQRFWSYRENPGRGGADSAPPPSGARVNPIPDGLWKVRLWAGGGGLFGPPLDLKNQALERQAANGVG